MEENKQETKKQIKVESIGASISSLLLDAIQQHKENITIATLGGRNIEEQENVHPDKKTMIRVRSLARIIESQVSMISLSSVIVKRKSMEKFDSSKSSDEDIDFDKFDCDYNVLMKGRSLLRFYSKSIRDAARTRTLKDDFVITRIDDITGTDIIEPSEHFFDMMEGLEVCFEEIYGILHKNGLISDVIQEVKTKRKTNDVY